MSVTGFQRTLIELLISIAIKRPANIGATPLLSYRELLEHYCNTNMGAYKVGGGVDVHLRMS